MEPASNGTGEPERCASARNSARISVSDDDDHDATSAAAVVMDGFRPAGPERAEGMGRAVPSTPSVTSGVSTLVPDESPATPPKASRSPNTPIPQLPRRSLSVRHELTALTRQASSSTDSSVYLPADGAYQGPSGPSHPYQLYPQHVRPARTMSVATSSTLPLSESSFTGPRGPSHPYSLYPQTDGVEAGAAGAAAIPIGFHDMPGPYRQGVGPDGEDVADIIHPDGHTEQLPPYTRYPEEAHVVKARGAGCPESVHGGASIVGATLTPPPPTASAIPGAGGLGLATRNPEFESTDDLDLPRSSRHSSRSFTSDDSQRRIRFDDERLSEKQKPAKKKWQIWMRRKLCGVVPCWAICLAAVVLMLMGVILGSVVGSLLAKHTTPHEDGYQDPTFDVIPLPTPSDLSPLPLGTFGMPLMMNRVSNTCLRDPSLSQAWNCHLVISDLRLTVSRKDGEYRATLDCNHSLTLSNNIYSYGEQPPLIQEPVTLQLVRDKLEPTRGPAWFKLLSYNKTVILPEAWLDSPGSASAPQRLRHAPLLGPDMANFKRKGIAHRGDKPWVCTWPDTYLELFIYAHQNSSSSNSPNPPSASSSPETSSQSSSSQTPGPHSLPTFGEGAYKTPPGGLYPPGGPVAGKLDAEALLYKGNWPQEFANAPVPTGNATGTDRPATTTTTTTIITRETSDTGPSDSAGSGRTTAELPRAATPTSPFGPVDTGPGSSPRRLPPYPRVVKLQERRVPTPGAAGPRCTQVEIQGPDQEARVARDSRGEPVVVDILETGGPPPPLDDEDADVSMKRSPDWDRKTDHYRHHHHQVMSGSGVPDISPCGCMWLLM